MVITCDWRVIGIAAALGEGVMNVMTPFVDVSGTGIVGGVLLVPLSRLERPCWGAGWAALGS